VHPGAPALKPIGPSVVRHRAASAGIEWLHLLELAQASAPVFQQLVSSAWFLRRIADQVSALVVWRRHSQWHVRALSGGRALSATEKVCGGPFGKPIPRRPGCSGGCWQ
jgi:hypothetical protein